MTTPDTPPPKRRGQPKTTRDDWITAALDILISDGIDQVSIHELSKRLSCARSSFYWYFKNRAELLEALLDHWQATNTRSIVTQANLPATSINFALVNVFRCWTNTRLFDTRLDFAIRDWARRSGLVRRALDISDEARIAALEGMFRRFDYPPGESLIRARIVYFTQIGYDALDFRETKLQRARIGADYIYCHTGVRPTPQEVAALVHLTGHTMHDIAEPPPPATD